MPQSVEDLELKVEETHIEQISVQNDRIAVTDEDSKRIVRKTDLYLLSLLAWVYFLQILDKVIIGYAAVFGLKEDTGLVGNQYSTVGSIGYYAQMAAQPIGAYVLVKFPVKVIMPVIVTCWGCALCGMAGANNFSGLMAGRFFLGFFEAMCLPLFSLITSQWYRRVEQPMRVATWFGTNGIASILGSLMAYGLSFIESDRLHNYQVMFLLTGGMTVVTGPALYWLLDNGPGEARFLTPEDRLKAVERLRSNNTGTTEHHNFKWGHVFEMITEMRGYMFFGMVLIVNMGASTTTVFGPLILKGMLGFTPRRTMLLNIPFGALQLIAILSSSWIAVRFRTRAYILFAMMVPVVAATAILYAVPRETAYIGGLLTGYYLLAFLFSAHPLLISWIISNTAGQTKKATYMASYNFSASLAHIFNPYIFKAGDEPHYIPGLRIVMIVFCILILFIVLTAVNLMVLNKRKEGQRERNGKTGKLEDLSMAKSFDNKRQVDDKNIGQNAMLDMTDRENDEFQYVI